MIEKFEIMDFSKEFGLRANVIECPYCGKKCSRKKMNTSLNPHKDKQGYPCSGRNGYLVDTKY